jgi:hypothetical protein
MDEARLRDDLQCFLAQQPISSIAWMAFPGDSQRASFIVSACDLVIDYTRAARLQVERIADDDRRADVLARANDPAWPAWQRQQWVDTHYYFICWNQVAECMKELTKRAGLASVSKVYDQYAGTFEDYRNARHHYEHRRERLAGGDKESVTHVPPEQLADLGIDVDPSSATTVKAFAVEVGGRFIIGGQSWEGPSQSLALLEQIVAELEEAVRQDLLPLCIQAEFKRRMTAEAGPRSTEATGDASASRALHGDNESLT